MPPPTSSLAGRGSAGLDSCCRYDPLGHRLHWCTLEVGSPQLMNSHAQLYCLVLAEPMSPPSTSRCDNHPQPVQVQPHRPAASQCPYGREVHPGGRGGSRYMVVALSIQYRCTAALGLVGALASRFCCSGMDWCRPRLSSTGMRIRNVQPVSVHAGSVAAATATACSKQHAVTPYGIDRLSRSRWVLPFEDVEIRRRLGQRQDVPNLAI